jgi:enterobacterial common antigen flippase
MPSDPNELQPPAPPSQPLAQAAAPEKHSYGDILKSSAMIGGASMLNIAIGIVRTKVMAVLLGPGQFGVMGLYGSIADLAAGIAGMGISSSGVRQIAEAAGSGDTGRIARTVTVLRRTATILGVIGALLVAAFSAQISTFTFGNSQHVWAVALLSLVVFFRLVTDGQNALIQGTRRISDLAKVGVLGAVLGTVIGIPIVYFLRADGVVPYLVCVAGAMAAIAWRYSRKLDIAPPPMTASQFRHEAAALLKFGLTFMGSGSLMMGAAYAVRTIVLREVGMEAAGFYQAAWTLGGLYVGNILQAMGADFYPRLVAAAEDDARCNRLVNEQEQVSLLLAGPGVLATLTFAPLVIAVFYSATFAGAVELLRWLCLGMALRVISWPMGYVIIARGRKALFFGTELAWAIANVGLTWIGVKSIGLNGAGIAFFAAYVFYGFLLYPIVRRLSGFRWSAANRKTGAMFIALIALVFCAFQVLPPLVALGVGMVATLLNAVHSMRILAGLATLDRIPRRLRRLIVWLR